MPMILPENIWKFVKRWEGGDAITNNPDDTGGLTKFGISQANNPDVNIRELTESKAKSLYLERYWRTAKCNEVPKFMQLIQFNCAVNCGPSTARKILQKSVGAKADGRIGPNTKNRIMRFGNNPRVFVGKYLTFQVLYYFNIVQRRKSQHVWLKGWVRRTLDAMWITAVTYGQRKL
jgi:lysozyme family protein